MVIVESENTSFIRSRPKFRVEQASATILLLLLAPVLIVAALAVILAISGTVLVQYPRIGPSGRLAYHTGFRTTRQTPRETPNGPVWTTAIGTLLRRSGLWRLPVLLDIRAGRLRFRDAAGA